ncbi:MAG: ComEA family DNA-binding protein [Pseudoalteromonas sp.]|uniref:ComEA family DNA-binding protein n=1 Tax=unclassified Pseudoalteromonas TaxID=194690 RepID=UPI003F982FC8
MKFITLIVVLLLSLSFSHVVTAEPAKSKPMSEMKSDKVNINSASAEQLAMLPGIGESKAQAIINYRTKKGEFKSVEELTQVKGIGDKLLSKLEGKVTL